MSFIVNMSIGRKLFLGFASVVSVIAVMGAVTVKNLVDVQRAARARDAEIAMSDAMVRAEFYLARQENSYRGYLISRDPYYLRRVEAHRAKFLDALRDLGSESPVDLTLGIQRAVKSNDDWYKNVVQVGQVMVHEGQADSAARMVGRDGVADNYIAPVEDAIEDLKEASKKAVGCQDLPWRPCSEQPIRTL